MPGPATPTAAPSWNQPGGWFYNLLPYIEQPAMHNLGLGMGAWNSTTPNGGKMAANTLRLSTPVVMVYCPTRRAPIAYPWTGSWNAKIINANTPSVAGRSDYAINGGDYYTDPGTGGWPSGAYGPATVTDVENPDGSGQERPPPAATSPRSPSWPRAWNTAAA